MEEIGELLKRIEKLIAEKDEAIGVQIDQIVELEEKVEALEEEVARLRSELKAARG